MVLECGFHDLRRHDRPGAETRQIDQPAQMTFVLGFTEILRGLNRQQIVNEEDGFDIRTLLQPGEIARDPERKLTDVEITRALRQSGGRRAAEGKAVPADPSQNSGRAMGTSPRNPVYRGGWRGLTPDPSGNPAIAFVLLRLVVFAPMNGNSIHHITRGRGRDRAWPERVRHDR